MKKKIFGGIAIVAIAATIAFNINLNTKKNNFSHLSIENIEALANENKDMNKGEPIDRSVTTTFTVKHTNEPGWSWSISANAWLFNGKVSHGSPSNSWEESRSVQDKFTCCESGVNKDCNHIMCEKY